MSAEQLPETNHYLFPNYIAKAAILSNDYKFADVAEEPGPMVIIDTFDHDDRGHWIDEN